MTDIVKTRLSNINNELKIVERKLFILATQDLSSKSYSDILIQVKNEMSSIGSVIDSIIIFNDIGISIKKSFKEIGLDILFDKTDADLIGSLSLSSYEKLNGIVRNYEHSITQILYNNTDNELLTSSISALILPSDFVGKSIMSVLNTEIDTVVMEVDSTLMLKKGKEAGITNYKYIGNLIADSRSWCVSHINKTFSEKEISAWEKSDWKGKKSGNPFITRGGWRCRHHFAPVLKST